MIKWSRVRLALSILVAEGLWRTLADRLKYAKDSALIGPGAKTPAGDTTLYDYAAAAHVHSTYSDGAGSIAEIAASARRAGADIVMLCDHNTLEAIENGEQTWHQDGKVLAVIGAEATTTHGYLLAFDLPGCAVPLPHDAIEAMRRIHDSGGYGYIALPCDLKGYWKDFSHRVPGIGIEVFNLSSIARTKLSIPGLLLALIRYRGSNPMSAFNYVAARPSTELRLWDGMLVESAERGDPLPMAIGCLDAHAVLKFRGQVYNFPTYEEVFRALRTHVLTASPLSRKPETVSRDLKLIHDALRGGRAYVAYDFWASATGFRCSLVVGDAPAGEMGETVPVEFGGARRAAIRVVTPNPRSIIRLYRNGRVVAVARGDKARFAVDEPGVYRVEVYLYRFQFGNLCFASRPWIFGNAINVVAAPDSDAEMGPEARAAHAARGNGNGHGPAAPADVPAHEPAKASATTITEG